MFLEKHALSMSLYWEGKGEKKKKDRYYNTLLRAQEVVAFSWFLKKNSRHK